MGEGLSSCTLCPRACGVDRAAGQKGWCGAGNLPRIYRYGPHFGEEPPLVGTKGSGTVFFSRCTLRCLYCQNWPWSQEGEGEDVTVERLTAILRELAEMGCHNWNLVSPTPWLPFIRDAVTPLLRLGISLPFVYNTSGFETRSTLEEYAALADIALCDLRYAREETASEASGAANYVGAARETVKWFWEKLGPLKLDGNGIARRGVICRLLALPGHVQEAVDNLEWLAENVGTRVHVSVMSQYTPVYKALEQEPWNRKLFEEEFELLRIAVDELGYDGGWVQEFEGEAPAGLLGQSMSAGKGVVGYPVEPGREAGASRAVSCEGAETPR